MGVYEDYQSQTHRQLSPLYITVFLIICSIVILFVYTIRMAIYIANASVNKNMLNIEALDYASIYSMYFWGTKDFNYTYFLIIFFGIEFLLTGRYYMSNYGTPKVFNKTAGPIDISDIAFTLIPENGEQVVPGLKRLVTIAVIAFFGALVLQSITTGIVYASIKRAEERTREMNNFIYDNIYKKGNFFKYIEKPKKNIIDVNNSINNCLKLLQKEQDPLQLAKGFYTLTLYYYYQNFSLKNVNINKAFEIFSLKSQLTRDKFPSGYMQRYGTFIENIGENIIRPKMPSTSHVNEAMFKCDEWISRTNEYANTIYPSEAYNAFMILIIMSVVIQGLLLGSIYYYGVYKI